jgi:hypothetical protein
MKLAYAHGAAALGAMGASGLFTATGVVKFVETAARLREHVPVGESFVEMAGALSLAAVGVNGSLKLGRKAVGEAVTAGRHMARLLSGDERPSGVGMVELMPVADPEPL